MKKVVTLFVSLILLALSLTSCLFDESFDDGYVADTTGGYAVEKSTTKPAECTHAYQVSETTATCQSGGYKTYQCSLCEDTYQEYESALGHTTDAGTCSRCGATVGEWKLDYYVDEFNKPTSHAYITTKNVCTGTFSNSATTNSKLQALILIDSEDVAIRLWEYGRNEVKAYSSTNYSITILDDAGNKHYTTGTMYENGDRIFMADKSLISLLQNNKKLEIYIKENSKYGVDSTYLFYVNGSNFKDVYRNYKN